MHSSAQLNGHLDHLNKRETIELNKFQSNTLFLHFAIPIWNNVPNFFFRTFLDSRIVTQNNSTRLFGNSIRNVFFFFALEHRFYKKKVVLKKTTEFNDASCILMNQPVNHIRTKEKKHVRNLQRHFLNENFLEEIIDKMRAFLNKNMYKWFEIWKLKAAFWWRWKWVTKWCWIRLIMICIAKKIGIWSVFQTKYSE